MSENRTVSDELEMRKQL